LNVDQQAVDTVRQMALRAMLGGLQMRRKVYRMEVAGKLAEAGRTSKLPLEFTSQFGECMTLWDLFEGQWEGYYIECGAYDGRNTSVTYPFEAMGWSGLLVEAIPAPAHQCAANRPNSRVIHCGPLAPRRCARGHISRGPRPGTHELPAAQRGPDGDGAQARGWGGRSGARAR
jgi:hypothetical protein